MGATIFTPHGFPSIIPRTWVARLFRMLHSIISAVRSGPLFPVVWIVPMNIPIQARLISTFCYPDSRSSKPAERSFKQHSLFCRFQKLQVHTRTGTSSYRNSAVRKNGPYIPALSNLISLSHFHLPCRLPGFSFRGVPAEKNNKK